MVDYAKFLRHIFRGTFRQKFAQFEMKTEEKFFFQKIVFSKKKIF